MKARWPVVQLEERLILVQEVAGSSPAWPASVARDHSRSTMTLNAVVLAAGKGTRMRSDLPKPLHEVRGRSLLSWVIRALDAVDLDSVVVVVGHGRAAVVSSLEGDFGDREFLFAEQLAQRGTGDAAAVGLGELDVRDPEYDDDDHVLIFPGDTPLLRSETVSSFVRAHEKSGAACTVMTARMADPTNYGRVLRTPAGTIASIVEERDATDEQRAVDEVNSGMYCFRRSLLAPGLRLISADNAQGELYLTDVVGVLAESGHTVMPYEADSIEIIGVNDRAQLGAAAEAIGERIAEQFMRQGVTIIQPSSTVISAAVTIEADVTLHPGTVVEGHSHIAAGAVIGPNTHLIDATIGTGAVVEASTIRGASIPAAHVIGPYEMICGEDPT